MVNNCTKEKSCILAAGLYQNDDEGAIQNWFGFKHNGTFEVVIVEVVGGNSYKLVDFKKEATCFKKFVKG